MLGPPDAWGLPQTPQTPGGPTAAGGVGAGDLLALGIWAVENGMNLIKGHALEVATLATGANMCPRAAIKVLSRRWIASAANCTRNIR